MEWLICVGLLLACGARAGAPSPPPVTPPAPAAELEEPRAEDAGHEGYELDFERPLNGSFTAADADEQIVLRVYSGLEKGGPSEEAIAMGFVTTPKLAELVLIDAGGKANGTWLAGEWEDGWEWGKSVEFEGTLAIAETGRQAVVARYSSYTEGPGLDSMGSKIAIIEVDAAGSFSEVWSAQANEITATIGGASIELELTDSRGVDVSTGEELLDTRRVVVVYGADGIEEKAARSDATAE